MKKLIDTIVIYLIFVAYCGIDICKKIKITCKFILIGTVVSFLLWRVGNEIYQSQYCEDKDCVPATFQRIFPQYSVKKIFTVFHSKRSGTDLQNILRFWPTLSTNKLNIVYNVWDIESMRTNQVLIDFDKTYVWIGYASGPHCALIRFTPTNVLMSHSQFVGKTTNYLTSTLEFTNFIRRTYLIMDTIEIKKGIRFY